MCKDDLEKVIQFVRSFEILYFDKEEYVKEIMPVLLERYENVTMKDLEIYLMGITDIIEKIKNKLYEIKYEIEEQEVANEKV